MEFRNIVILTGAGISADSGLATFRGADGLWEGHRVKANHAYKGELTDEEIRAIVSDIPKILDN